VAVLEAMGAWSRLERDLSEKAREYMRLGDTDMRALRYLIAAQRQGVLATPGMIATHLGITPAATTKLTDRLEAGGHIRRLPHPADRRRIAIEVTESTSASARASVGRSHARRFDAIASLSAEDRAAVLRFFDALTRAAEGIEPGLGEA
jgi:DNA-binding MarR family transcriptional regulator